MSHFPHTLNLELYLLCYKTLSITFLIISNSDRFLAILANVFDIFREINVKLKFMTSVLRTT